MEQNNEIKEVGQVTEQELVERLIRLSIRLQNNIKRAEATANVNLQALNGLPQLREELQALNIVIASFMFEEVKPIK